MKKWMTLSLFALAIVACKQPAQVEDAITINNTAEADTNQVPLQTPNTSATSSTVAVSDKQFSQWALDYELEDTTGKKVRLGEIINQHIGQPLVIDVWATWCPDCIKAIPATKELMASHPEAKIVYLSVDRERAKWNDGIKKYDLQGAHYFIPDGMKSPFGKDLELDWIPRYILLDKTGKIVTFRAIEKDFEAMHTTLTELKK